MHDHLYLRGADGTWAAEATVTFANDSYVHLGGLKIIQFGERSTPLYSDGTYRVAFTSGSFTVVRIADNLDMFKGSHFHTEALARQALDRLYPRQA